MEILTPRTRCGFRRFDTLRHNSFFRVGTRFRFTTRSVPRPANRGGLSSLLPYPNLSHRSAPRPAGSPAASGRPDGWPRTAEPSAFVISLPPAERVTTPLRRLHALLLIRLTLLYPNTPRVPAYARVGHNGGTFIHPRSPHAPPPRQGWQRTRSSPGRHSMWSGKSAPGCPSTSVGSLTGEVISMQRARTSRTSRGLPPSR